MSTITHSHRNIFYIFFFFLVTALTLSSEVLADPSIIQKDASQCKNTPASPDWPRLSEWTRFNQSIGGRLLQPTPPGAVCHPDQPSFNAALCNVTQAGWLTYDWHSENPISTDWNNWNSDTCLPDPSYPCSGAGYPVYSVNATCAEDVQAAVQFAIKHQIRLVVKASGHDYVGRSNAPNSLSIWIHYLKGIQIHDSFQPKSCTATIAGGAVTVGGGQQMVDILEALAPLNRTIVGGSSKSVGVSGHMTSGGHSILSSTYGLAADQALEMEIVTPQGELVTANECQNQDLFWAMRGGGGSTFGVITSVTVKTIPSPQMITLTYGIVTPNPNTSSPITMEMNAYMLSQFPSLMDKGLTGYNYMFGSIPNPLPGGEQGIFGGIFGVVNLLDTQDPQAILDLFEPLQTYINATWPGVFEAYMLTTPYASLWDWFQVNYDQSASGSDYLLGSRLLTKETLQGTDQKVLSEKISQWTSSGIATAYLVAGPGVRDATPRGGSNAVLPAWRKAYIHSVVGLSYQSLNETDRSVTMSTIDYLLEAVTELEPDSGSYVNEGYPYTSDWQQTFWGANYERLVEIKRTIDPDDVLWCHPCVGSERWQEVDGKLCRV